jgi:sarcosine oxidase, subunit gamma
MRNLALLRDLPSETIATPASSEAAPAVRLTPLPRFARLTVRGDEEAVAAIGRGFGIALPRTACRAATQDRNAALWLGPDEWLLIAPEGQLEAVAAAIGASLGGIPASVVDVSDRNVAIEVAGPKAAEAINAFNALDLDEAAFPVSTCTRTLFAKAEIVLWRTRPDTFHIEVWRSFAPYVRGLLEEACLEFEAAG